MKHFILIAVLSMVSIRAFPINNDSKKANFGPFLVTLYVESSVAKSSGSILKAYHGFSDSGEGPADSTAYTFNARNNIKALSYWKLALNYFSLRNAC